MSVIRKGIGRSAGLTSFFNVESPGYPVIAEVMGEVEDADVGEARILQFAEGRADVWAAIPGAASAVKDDELVFGKGANPLAEDIKACCLGTGPRVLRAGNVGFSKHEMRTDLQNERRLMRGLLQKSVELIGLQEGILRDGEGAARAGLGLKLRMSEGAGDGNEKQAKEKCTPHGVPCISH